MNLRNAVLTIINQSIEAALPDSAVANALRDSGISHIIAIGKAA